MKAENNGISKFQARNTFVIKIEYRNSKPKKQVKISD